ncbi:hypothetical protein LTR06_005343 [Exophiala xenobiotica]|nr:hypothetical protein LTR06_005343 [Exophiala xenobiotica]
MTTPAPLQIGLPEWVEPTEVQPPSPLPDRVGPWPLKRNRTSSWSTGVGSETTIAGSSSQSVKSVNTSGDASRAASPDMAGDTRRGHKERRKSELTATLEEVDKQCATIQRMLDAEEAALKKDFEDIRRHVRERSERQNQRLGRPAQEPRDLEQNAGAPAQGRAGCLRCAHAVDDLSRTISAACALLTLSCLMLLLSPWIFDEAFGHGRNQGLDRREYFFLFLGLPVCGMTAIFAVTLYGLQAIRKRARRKLDTCALIAYTSIWSVVVYLWLIKWWLPLV